MCIRDRRRTDCLFRLANPRGGIVLGTGDLSELALGWCTYGVGDQMSHYNVNAGVPKTLIQHLIRWVIESGQFEETTGQVLGELRAEDGQGDTGSEEGKFADHLAPCVWVLDPELGLGFGGGGVEKDEARQGRERGGGLDRGEREGTGGETRRLCVGGGFCGGGVRGKWIY